MCYCYVDHQVNHKMSFMVFIFSLDQLLSNMNSQNPFFPFYDRWFNAIKSSPWKNGCLTRDGTEIESLPCSYWLSQLIFDLTHIIQNSSSCMKLVLTNQLNFLINNGVHPSLHPYCHHRIVFWKLNLKIRYSPVYERLMSDYKK